MRLRDQTRLRASMVTCVGLLVSALFAVVLWSGRARGAVLTGRTGAILKYASPIELLFSPDGTRLYVLCQQSGEVRVLDATTYAVIKNIAVGRVPRGFSLSPDGFSAFRDEFLGRHAIGDRYELAGSSGDLAGGLGAFERARRSRRKARLRGQSHFERCGGAGREDGRGREKAGGWTRR